MFSWNGNKHQHVRSIYRFSISAMTLMCILFIGTVKEEDNVFFPPWKPTPPSLQRRASFTAYSSQPNQITANFVPSTQKVLPPKSSKYRNKYHNHAKEGFKYWYQEPKPIDCKYFLVKRIIIWRKILTELNNITVYLHLDFIHEVKIYSLTWDFYGNSL